MNFEDSIRDVLFILGLAIVVSMAAAALIRLMVFVLSLGDIWAEWRAKSQPKPEAKTILESGGIPAHHLVAITVAAHAMATRVLHIHSSSRQAHWSADGRAAHHSSHQMNYHH